MKKTAKIYIINIGGSIRNIKAFSKAQISKRLNISIYNINYDCQMFSLIEWKEVTDNKIDIDLVKLPLLEDITQ
jgi:alkyl hydroperoxide reductase subunit AhpC